jgi:hypothetical protein
MLVDRTQIKLSNSGAEWGSLAVLMMVGGLQQQQQQQQQQQDDES